MLTRSVARAWWLVLVSLAIGTAACGTSSPPSPAATVPTAVMGQPYAVPRVITKAYVQRVLNALEVVEAQATVNIASNRAFTTTAADLLHTVTTPSEYRVEKAGWLNDLRTGLANIPAHPGPVVDIVQQVFPSTTTCIFVSATRDFGADATRPPPLRLDYFVLRSAPANTQPGDRNPTPWIIDQVGYNSQGLVPGDVCGA